MRQTWVKHFISTRKAQPDVWTLWLTSHVKRSWFKRKKKSKRGKYYGLKEKKRRKDCFKRGKIEKICFKREKKRENMIWAFISKRNKGEKYSVYEMLLPVTRDRHTCINTHPHTHAQSEQLHSKRMPGGELRGPEFESWSHQAADKFSSWAPSTLFHLSYPCLWLGLFIGPSGQRVMVPLHYHLGCPVPITA